MKKISVRVAVKGRVYRAQLPTYKDRPGYLLTSSAHPGREFALTRAQNWEGKALSFWVCIDCATGYRVTANAKAPTRKALESRMHAYLASTAPEELDRKFAEITLKRARQFLAT